MYNVFAFYTFLWIPSSLGAVINLIRGQKTWVKTGRTAIEEFIELREDERVDVAFPVEVNMGGRSVELTVRDVSAGGIGIQATKGYFVEHAIEVVSVGNTVTVITPRTGTRVRSLVVWVAYLGSNQVRAGMRFDEPEVLDLKECFGIEVP